MLIGYAVSGEPTLLAYNARLTPFAEPFMALFGRNQLPHRSTLSRFLAALDQPTVEVLRVLFQKDVLARNPFPSSGGLFDRRGMQWVVIDVDGTRQAARQRALPQTDGLPAPHRRFDLVCAPGYQGRKRGEVVRTRTVVLQAHTHQFLGTFGGPGNGDYRGELRRAIEVITSYAIQLGLSLSSILVRLDGLYGDAAPLLDVLSTGLGVIARSRAYHLLDLDIVKSRLLCAPDQISTHPESSAIRALYDCLSVPLTPAGPNVRLVIATHAGTSSSPAVGTERDGMVYKLFASTLPSPAFTASDVLDLYLHRGSFETVLSDGTYTLSTITLQQKVTSKMKPSGVPLCSDQKFASQPTGGFCTGFFITPSCIMTAGHCIVDTSNQLLVPLSELRFITGFKMTSQTNAITNFKTSQIFTGVQLIRSQSGSSDFAIVQVSCLDGKTQGVPLPISPLRSAYLKESVFAIGYPTGLPTKLAPNAVVQNTGSATTFLTNLDVFRANSGSPVCDVTNTVVGILVNGPKEQDYVPDPKQGCKVLNTFSSPDIPGTIGVQRITGVVGPVYDLSLQLNIGKEGLRGDVFGGRQILLRLKNGVPPVSIPHGSLDAYTSYTFPLNPTLLGIDHIDAIDFVEINSPGLDRPWTDVWSLDRVLLYVNGEQLLYNFDAQHTFDDKAGDNKWVEDVTPLPDNSISGNTLLCYGSTPKGSTNWQQYTHNSLCVEINTSAANFSTTPQYFASLGGDSKQWQTQGVSAIYYPTSTKFSIYIQYLEGDITPAQANAMNWYVNWMGIESY